MTVQNFTTDELADGYRGLPINDHGKLRYQFFNLSATSVAGDATSEIDLCNLPPGRVRILPHLSRLTNSAFGAGRTLDVGLRAYINRDPETQSSSPDIAEDADALAAAIDVADAADSVAINTTLKYDVYSKDGIGVFATVNNNTIPQGATISGCIAYIYE